MISESLRLWFEVVRTTPCDCILCRGAVMVGKEVDDPTPCKRARRYKELLEEAKRAGDSSPPARRSGPPTDLPTKC